MKDLEKELEERDQKIAELESKMAELVKENDRLRDLLESKAEAKSSRKPRFSDNYSGQGEQKRKAEAKAPQGDGQAVISRPLSAALKRFIQEGWIPRIACWFAPSALGASSMAGRFTLVMRFLIDPIPQRHRCPPD